MKTVEELFKIAIASSAETHDPRTAVGCVIFFPENEVTVTGSNSVPAPLEILPGDERLLAPAKYLWIEHAERAAIYRAARQGLSTYGATLYVYGGFPCADCARAIIASGIATVWYHVGDSEVGHWEEHYEVSRRLFEKANVSVHRRFDHSSIVTGCSD
jgi:dCMP deaminase